MSVLGVVLVLCLLFTLAMPNLALELVVKHPVGIFAFMVL